MSRFLELVLEAMAKEDRPTYKGGVQTFFNPELKKSKNGIKYRQGAGHFARYSNIGGLLDPTGQSMKTLHHMDRTAKAYLGPGGSLARGDKVGVEGNRYLGKRAAKIGGVIGGLAGGIATAAATKNPAKAGAAAIASGLYGAGSWYAGQRATTGIARKWYRGKAEKIGVK